MTAILLSAFFLGVPWVLGSLITCAPKWWDARGALGSGIVHALTVPRRGPNLRPLIALVGTPLVAVFGLSVVYTCSVVALIERKCPYRDGQLREQDRPEVSDLRGCIREMWSWAWQAEP